MRMWIWRPWVRLGACVPISLALAVINGRPSVYPRSQAERWAKAEKWAQAARIHMHKCTVFGTVVTRLDEIFYNLCPLFRLYRLYFLKPPTMFAVSNFIG